MSFAVVVFEKREDGERAIDALNGYEAGGRCGNRRLVVSHFPKSTRFFSLQEMLFIRRRKTTKEQQEVKACSTSFWRDPGATFCSVCGEDKENHLELKCPYNYLSPATYSPCKVRLALWGNYTTTLRYKCARHKEEEQREPPVHDEANSRRLGFMRCFVRVNNLPEQCHPEELAALFSRFGPLRMWHVATGRSGACKGFGGLVFQKRDHADEAIEALNCHAFGDRKLRVDWAYPCLNC
ncbi:hypothetical protein PR202_gb25873 [Eleusine coracana subsp. coracana]|uniref:RRM domain-containing protein n=1 Tax=Eleusine coracana subsp. coracana TaxID=191504 RepID=A0AAV5FQE4_ELECO|nr:hypothetical protein PR202_gb25873 [Eleusine coracana subsp. coracana]